MATLTTDHTSHPAPGACQGCSAWKLCAPCMGRMQAARYAWQLRQWLERWGNTPRRAVRARPALRLVKG